MNKEETRLVAIGAGLGILAAAIAVEVFTGRGAHWLSSSQTLVAARASKDLQPEAAAASQPVAQSGTEPGTTVELTPAEITAAGVQVADVRTASLKTDIDAFGRVEQPEAQLAAVSARIAGRVDKLYVQYTGERVRSGQAVAEIYSPEVAAAIEEYHLAQENLNGLGQSEDAFARSQADALVKASKHKLELWGINEKQMDGLGTNGTPHVTIYAYAGGTVVDRKVTQGQYVNVGDTLFTVADLSQVWIKADVYEEQLPLIRAGQQVKLTADSLPNQILNGHVDFIEPAANPQTRTVPVHVHVANPGMRLLPGMFVSATFVSRAAQPSIVVPRSAVLDTGTRKIVYLARPNGVFEAREVEVGAPGEELYPVSRGLALGDRVVLNGNFLIDSQAHLSSGMSGLYGGSKEFGSEQQGQTGTSTASGETAEQPSAKIDVQVDPSPMKMGADNQFHASLTGVDGKPIADASVTVTLLMPAMPSMGMPEMKDSFDLRWDAGKQMYVGKGQPGSAGTWTVLAEARRNGKVIASSRTHLNAQ